MTPHKIPTLRDLCLRQLSRHIDGLTDVGCVPFEMIAPVLKQCSAAKLAELEAINGWPAESTSEYWKALCLRDFGSSALSSTSGETNKWADVYRLLEQSKKDKLEKMRSSLKAQYGRVEQKKIANRTVVIDRLPPKKRGKGSGGGISPKGVVPRKSLFAKALKETKLAMR